jgi:hypothetical protein
MATLEDLNEDTIKELALLGRELSENPKTRRRFLQLTKEARPETPVPELELDERISAATKSADDRVAALEARLAEKDMRSELERRRQALKENGVARTDDDIEAIEKIMLEKNIANHETAADYWRLQRESAPPTPPNYDRNFIDSTARDALKKYWKNPNQAAREDAAQALKDLRSGKVRLA